MDKTTLGAISHSRPPFVSPRGMCCFGASLLYLFSHSTINYSTRCLIDPEKSNLYIFPIKASISLPELPREAKSSIFHSQTQHLFLCRWPEWLMLRAQTSVCPFGGSLLRDQEFQMGFRGSKKALHIVSNIDVFPPQIPMKGYTSQCTRYILAWAIQRA